MTAPDPGPGPYQPPDHGYRVPPTVGTPLPGAGGPELDPLVPPPWSGLNPAYERLVATLRRSWRPLGVIMLVTFAAPQLVLNAVGAAAGFGVGVNALDLSAVEPAQLVTGAVGLSLLVTVGLAFVNAIGWGAGIWTVTQQAAGQPATVADALRVGLRRSGPMFGWYLLLGLMVLAGLLACVVPGVYVAVAGSLFSFAVIYERRGVGRSFGLVHRSFGAALGRVLLLAAVLLAATCLVGTLVSTLGSAAATAIGPADYASAGVRAAATLIDAAVAVPLNMVLVVGLLLTYTQLRAREEPISTGELWVEANQP